MKLFFLVLVLALLAACQPVTNPQQQEYQPDGIIIVEPMCADGTVCFVFDGYNAGGLDCTQDNKIVAKYCGGVR